MLAPVAGRRLSASSWRWLFLRPLYRRGHLDQVLLTFGFTFVFFDLVQSVWGRDGAEPAGAGGAAGRDRRSASACSPTYRLFLIALGFVIALLLWLFLERSRLGAMVRAGVDDAGMAAGLGGNIPALFTGDLRRRRGAGGARRRRRRRRSSAFIPAWTPKSSFPPSSSSSSAAWAACAAPSSAACLIGVADTFGKAYLPSMALFLIYLVMAVVLLARPQGLFGIKYSGVRPPAAVATDKPRRRRGRRALAGPRRRGGAAGLPAVLVADYPRALVTEIFIFAIFAMSLDLLLGYTGLMSLGHAAFFGLGAYVVIVLGTQFGINAWLGVVAGRRRRRPRRRWSSAFSACAPAASRF